MSNKTKKISMWSLKALAVGLFVFLAVVNVQMVTGADVSVSDISATMPSATAEGGGAGYSCTVTRNCGGGNSVSCTGSTCEFVPNGVKCNDHTTLCP